MERALRKEVKGIIKRLDRLERHSEQAKTICGIPIDEMARRPPTSHEKNLQSRNLNHPAYRNGAMASIARKIVKMPTTSGIASIDSIPPGLQLEVSTAFGS